MSLDNQTFWKLELPAEVEQWDIFADVPFSMPVTSAYLKSTAPGKGISHAYNQHPTPQKAKDGRFFSLSEAKTTAGMLLNYECDFDKSKRTTLAMVYPVVHIPTAQRDNVIAGKNKSLIFLPGLNVIGDAVADLRSIYTFPKETIAVLPRLASLSPKAKELARAHMAGYFFRVKWPDDLAPPPFAE